jgi:hypothetical protein
MKFIGHSRRHVIATQPIGGRGHGEMDCSVVFTKQQATMVALRMSFQFFLFHENMKTAALTRGNRDEVMCSM